MKNLDLRIFIPTCHLEELFFSFFFFLHICPRLGRAHAQRKKKKEKKKSPFRLILPVPHTASWVVLCHAFVCCAFLNENKIKYSHPDVMGHSLMGLNCGEFFRTSKKDRAIGIIFTWCSGEILLPFACVLYRIYMVHRCVDMKKVGLGEESGNDGTEFFVVCRLFFSVEKGQKVHVHFFFLVGLVPPHIFGLAMSDTIDMSKGFLVLHDKPFSNGSHRR